MKLKTINNIDVQNKRVLLRVDFNVPISKKGEITDDSRMIATLPTITHLTKKGAKIIIISHLGRPKGKKVSEMSLKPVAKHLEKLTKTKVTFVDECIGKKAEEAVNKMKKNEIIVLENVRFHKEESKNDKTFSKELAKLADIYVNDAFSVAHRAHASTTGVTNHLPSYGGFLMAKEIHELGKVFKNAKKPICLIIGGAKINTKIGVLKKFIEIADSILVGGALGNTFLAARGFNVGKSKYEKDKLLVAQEIMLLAEQKNHEFRVPRDVVVASEISETSEKIDIPTEDIVGDMMIVDIGKVSIKRYTEIIKKAGTVIWNGPVGVYEFNRFSHGSKRIAESILESKALSIIGGGDTIDFLKKYDYPLDKFSHISTGGGAMIEFLEGKKLPGITAVSS